MALATNPVVGVVAFPTLAVLALADHPEKETRDSALKALDQLRRFNLLGEDDKDSIRSTISRLSTSPNPDISHDMSKALENWKYVTG